MRRRAPLAFLLLLVLAACISGHARANDHMWAGFTDDPELRYNDDRAAQIGLVASSHATVIRTLVQWWTT